MERLSVAVMRAFAEALVLPRRYLDSFVGAPILALRALYSPATSGAPEAGQQRAGAHPDDGSLTMVLLPPSLRGLGIRHPTLGSTEAPFEARSLVVNIGDLMARWSAERWTSPLHCLMARPGRTVRRSLAFFAQPDVRRGSCRSTALTPIRRCSRAGTSRQILVRRGHEWAQP